MSDIESSGTFSGSLDTPWPEFLRLRVLHTITTSSLNERQNFLNHALLIKIRRKDLPEDSLPTLLSLLFTTYPRYQDRASRDSVLAILRELNNWNSELFLKMIVPVVTREAENLCKKNQDGQLSTSATNRFVLLTWVNLLITCVLSDYAVEIPEHFSKLVSAESLLLGDLAGEKRRGLRHGAFADTRRCIRKNYMAIPAWINILSADATTTIPNYKNSVLLGVVVDTAFRLKPTKQNNSADGQAMVVANKDHIIQFYLNGIVSSKTRVPLQYMIALQDFFRRLVTKEEFTATLAPVLEKMILRAPEIVLSDLVTLIPALSFDISSFWADKLLESLLNLLRSTSEVVRRDAVQLWKVLSTASKDVDRLLHVVAAVNSLVQSGKVNNWEHRYTLYTIMEAMSTPALADISSKAAEGLLVMITKETNETALSAVISALGKHLGVLMTYGNDHNKEFMEKVVKSVVDGLGSNKAGVRKAWAIAVGDIIWDEKEGSVATSTQVETYKMLPPLLSTFEKIAANPLIWKDGPLEGFITVAIVDGRMKAYNNKQILDLLNSKKFTQTILTTSPKPSFLIWDRVYTKIQNVQDGVWLLRGLQGLLSNEDYASIKKANTGIYIAQVLIYLAANIGQHEIRKETLKTIVKVNERTPNEVGEIISEGLAKWLDDLEKQNKESTAVTTSNLTAELPVEVISKRYASILRSITTFTSSTLNEIREKTLVKLVILAHHPLVVSPTDKYDWITLIQGAGIDPGNLVESYGDKLKDLIWKEIEDGSQSKMFYEAAISAISTLTFVRPQKMIPIFLSEIIKDLDPKQLESIGSLEYNIWKTEEGKVFVDVLKRNKQVVEDPNSKGYADMKWEEEVRAEIAKKKGITSQQKLTKTEQATLNAQLAKESAIRKSVQVVYEHISRGLRLVRAIAKGGGDNIEINLVDLVRLLLQVGQKGAGILVGEEIISTYLAISKCTVDKMTSIRTALGLATLRAMKISPIPYQWEEEPLNHLVTRVLYRLRGITENDPLSPASFAYSFPIVYHVIREGGIGIDRKTSEGRDEALEQIAVAVDVTGYHCSLGESSLMPRAEMIESLLMIVKDHPNLSKGAKTYLVTLCEAIGETATSKEVDTLFLALLSEESAVRVASLQALEHLDLTDIDFSSELWLASHDSDDLNSTLAKRLWTENAMEVEKDFREKLLELVIHDTSYVRICACKALAAAVALYPEEVVDTMTSIYTMYKDKAKPLVPEYDAYGMVIPSSLNRKDPVDARAGLALALKDMAPLMRSSELPRFLEFLITDEALGDRSEHVRQGMLEAGLAVVNIHGAENVQYILPVFERYLGTPAHNSESHDRIRESTVILFGATSGFLEEGDPKIRDAINKLIETLRTPSEAVQSAVAECLPPLVKMVKSDIPVLVSQLLNMLFKSEKYAERRGAAYGLAGVVKGRGISALKECAIMDSLKTAIEDKKNPQSRQGALFAFETLTSILGRLFEPYIIQIIPFLLICFGDSVADIREATGDAARVIMSKISGHCVRLIMPSVLAGLNDRQWRTKKGSVELLGSMAYCAPKQLSISLPTIVPRLTEVLTDSHPQVQAAANQSLLLFGEVISNPEIQQLVPVLLNALSDPNGKTKPALTALLETPFVHYIDAPSLALVIPILERGLRERSTEIKTKAAQIVGNMASLTDMKDLIPYLPRLMPGVKEVLVDPVPEARATVAKALGSLVEKLGESNFPDLVNELVNTLKSDTSGVDRQGAAQGLSEVLAGLGLDRLDGLLPEIIANADSPKAYVREGFISLLIYLPATFGVRFQPYLGRVIPAILIGLADESEYVRDASLRAGRMIVINYATKAVDLLLPELEKGLFDDNWRIRHSSIQLVGDLLFRITGTSKQAAMDALNNDVAITESEEVEEEEVVTEASRKALLEVLGKERRDRVLAALYIVRQDVSGVVRQASLQVWKAIVSNTPRTLKDILPVMMAMVIRNVASSSYDRRTVAARTLGDLVRKLGESVLADIIPMLENGLESTESNTRQGVCIALGEIMATAGKAQVMDYGDSIIPAVKKALCDPSGDVREAAAQAFDTLHQALGNKAIDEILPALLNSLQLSDESSVYALEALKEIMAVRANVVFPVLIPTLISVPISTFHAKALGSLVTVAGPALNKRLNNLLTALMDSSAQEKDPDTLNALRDTTRSVLLSIDNAEGLHTLMMMLLEYVKNDKATTRAGAAELLAVFANETKLDFSRYTADWVRTLIALLDDRQPTVVQASWNALNAITKSLKKDDLEALVIPTRRAVKSIGVAGVDLPGFCLPKGISPILPIFLQGLMYGTTEIREQSAFGIGDIIQRSSADALKPFVTQITGPLIRIIGDRYPSQVKAAILQTLSLLLSKVPAHLKPFLPQLQRTFIKSLTDPTSAILRSRAASALGILISMQIRVDPLVTELVTSIKTSEPNVKETIMRALESVINKAGTNMAETSKKGVIGVISEGLTDEDNSTIIGASRLFGCLCASSSVDEGKLLIDAYILSDEVSIYGSLLSINALLVNKPSLIIETGYIEEIVAKTLDGCVSNQQNVSDAAILAAGKIMLTNSFSSDEIIIKKLITVLSEQIKEPSTNSTDTKRLSAAVFRAVGRKSPEILEKHLITIVPPLMISARDRIVPVKLVAERSLIYILQLLKDENVFQSSYLTKVEPAESKLATDYHRRVLSKLVQQEQQRLEQLHGDIDQEAEEDDSEVWAIGALEKFEKTDDAD